MEDKAPVDQAPAALSAVEAAVAPGLSFMGPHAGAPHAALGKGDLVAFRVLPLTEGASSPNDWLAAFVSDSLLVPHSLIFCHHRCEAAFARGGVLPRGAFVAQGLVVLGRQGLTGHGAQAAGTVEAGVVPAAVLTVPFLGVLTDQLAASHSGVGESVGDL